MSNLRDIFEKQKLASRFEAPISLEFRQEALSKLIELTEEYELEICDAIREDFGNRHNAETSLGDIIPTLSALKHMKRRLPKWVLPKSAKSSAAFFPGKSHIELQPLGVIGIIAPWNYPYQLALIPAAQALAAGNRVILKPSELTPKTSALLATMINNSFEDNYFQVVEGDATVGNAIAELPFDHLVFTGSTAVGREIAKAAALNLTPLTLELGGKSPVIFEEGADFETYGERLTFWKLLNAGQTCIAPDYVLVHTKDRDILIRSIRRTIDTFYPDGVGVKDYTSIINEKHFMRLKTLIDDAELKGAGLIEMGIKDKSFLTKTKRIPPTLLLDTTDDMEIMREEIFGPILPILTYENLDDCLKYINTRPRPLALYYFGTDKNAQNKVLKETTSGGVTINDIACHFAQENLPFGGVGPSGMGTYHGEHGFKAFSHQKGIFTQTKYNALHTIYPPYGKIGDLVRKFFRKII